MAPFCAEQSNENLTLPRVQGHAGEREDGDRATRATRENPSDWERDDEKGPDLAPQIPGGRSWQQQDRLILGPQSRTGGPGSVGPKRGFLANTGKHFLERAALSENDMELLQKASASSQEPSAGMAHQLSGILGKRFEPQTYLCKA